MNVKVIEEKDSVIRVEIDDVTLVNLLNEKIWDQKGVEFSAYRIDHPYMSKPVITVRSKNPKKALIDAADQVAEDIGTLRKKLQAALK